MSNKEQFSPRSDVSFASLLFLTFLVLKLTNVIDWSWWWVTAPIWMPLAFGILMLLIMAMFLKRNIVIKKVDNG